MTKLHPTLEAVTERVRRRSRLSRQSYLDKIHRAARDGRTRTQLSCSNLAHGFAACGAHDKEALKEGEEPNIAIVSAYNDMLSAHQPFETYPQRIKEAVRQRGAVAQFAGGVPAMCDGVTQGQPGMELSLFSRDVIALSTAVALSHNMFDGAVCMGVCDKIIPGLLLGALSFGHLPVVFIPAGPMPSGLSNKEKARIRQLYAEGKISQRELLDAESASYHSPGTCTFYGTANSNQMFMEILGLHLPGASFINPGTALRDALTDAAAQRVVDLVHGGEEYTPLGEIVDERAILNAVVGLLATGGSTNHTLHLVAIARAAGVIIDWQDFDRLSSAVPLLARVYPNGSADVNHFHQAGGLPFLIGQLLDAGLLHPDVRTIAGPGLERYRREALLEDGELAWRPSPEKSRDALILRSHDDPFQATGGLRLVDGKLGRGVVKTSAVKEKHRRVEAPARIFERQEELVRAFDAGELDRDFVAVVRFQGPRANGMPELHKLMPQLGVLQDRGHSVALVTDGRLSGASGKVLSAIHLTPEAAVGGPLARLQDGDRILLDPENGVLEVQVPDEEWEARSSSLALTAPGDLGDFHQGLGRELFTGFRAVANGAEQGAMSFGAGAFGHEPHPALESDGESADAHDSAGGTASAARPAPAEAVLGGSFEDA
ncbi:MAG: phosphogluconate dehydratase [Acidobacteriota bacterium]|nr:phosphogluconate dehydratase [Acidobacteriota bacterium]